MTPKANPSSDAWTQRPADRTSQTDDARIKDITVLPPPEHLIRFFPIHGTPGVAHVPSPRQKVEADAPVPLFRLLTGRLLVTAVERLTFPV